MVKALSDGDFAGAANVLERCLIRPRGVRTKASV